MNLSFLIVLGIYLVLGLVYVYYGYISEYKLARLIILYLKEKGIEATNSREFSFKEKIRYVQTRQGMLYFIIGGFFLFFLRKLGENYYRVISIKQNGEEKTIYVEIFIKLRKIHEFNIIDSYEL